MSVLRIMLIAILVFGTTSLGHASDNLSRYWIGTGTAWEIPGNWYEYSNETQGHRSSEAHACTPSDPCGTDPKPTGEYGLPTASQQALLENKQGRINSTSAHPFTREPASKYVTLNSNQTVRSLVVEGDGGWENGGGEMALDIQSGSLNLLSTVIGYGDVSAYIGRFGRGKISVQEGASLTTARGISMGSGYWNMYSVGTLEILGGTVNAGAWEVLGGATRFSSFTGQWEVAGEGHVKQTGGVHSIATDLEIAAQSDVTMTGGIMSVGREMRVGTGRGLAKVSQSGDSQVTVGINLLLRGGKTDPTGDVYNMGGASILTVSGETVVGADNIAKMTLDGTATHTTNYLMVGNVTGGDGMYEAGGNSVTNVRIGANIGRSGKGDVLLKDSAVMNVAESVILGTYSGSKGDFTMRSGAALNARDVVLAQGEGYFLNQGTLNVSGTTLVGTGAVLNEMVTDGAAATHTTGVLKLAAGGDNWNAAGTYTLNGGKLDVADAALIGINGQGTLGLLSGARMTVANHMSLGTDGAAAKYGVGVVSSGAGTFLTATDLIVGEAGRGSFLHDGTVSVLNNLTVGRYSDGNTYQLGTSGNLSVAGNEFIGGDEWLGIGKGAFTQNGGRHSVAKSLMFGRNVNSVGAYVMQDGMLNVSENIIVGDSGAGLFTQNGGAVKAAGLVLGKEETGAGAYVFNNGALDVLGDTVVGGKGSGSFTQNGGINETGGLIVANESGSSGVYDMNDGSLIVNGPAAVGLGGNGSMRIASGNASFKGTVNVGAQAGSAGSLVFDSGKGDIDRGIDAFYFTDSNDDLKDAFENSGDAEIASRAAALADAIGAMKSESASVWKSRDSFAEGLKAHLTGTADEKARIAKLITDNQALLNKLARGNPISRDEDDAALTRGRVSFDDVSAERLASKLGQTSIDGMQDGAAARRAANAIRNVSESSSRDVFLDEDKFVEVVGGGMGDALVQEGGFSDGSDEALQARALAREQASAIFNDHELWQNLAGESPSGTKTDRANLGKAWATVNSSRGAYSGLTTDQMTDLFTGSSDATLSGIGAVAAEAVKTVAGKAGFSQSAAAGGAAFQQAVRGELQNRLYEQAKARAWDENGIDFDKVTDDPDEAATIAQAKALAIAQAAANAARGAQMIANDSSVLAEARAKDPTRTNSAAAIKERGFAALAATDGQKLEQELRHSGLSPEKARNLVLEVQNLAQNASAGIFKPTVSSSSPGPTTTALAEALAASKHVTAAEAEQMLSDTDLLRRVGNSSNLSLDTDKVVSDWGRNAMSMANQTQLTDTLTSHFLAQETDPSSTAQEAAAAKAGTVAQAIAGVRETGGATAFSSSARLKTELVSRGIDAALAQQVAGDTNLLSDVASRAIDNAALSSADRSRAALTSLGEGQIRTAFQTSHSNVLADPDKAAMAAKAIVGVRNGAGSMATFQDSDPEVLRRAIADQLVTAQGMAEDAANNLAGEVVYGDVVQAKLGALGPLSQQKIGGAAAQGRSSYMGMTKPQLMVAVSAAGTGVTGVEETEQVADAIMELQQGASAATFLNAAAFQSALGSKGVRGEVANALANSPAVLSNASKIRGFSTSVASTDNAQALKNFMTMNDTQVENSLRKSRVTDVSSRDVAREIAEALDKVRSAEKADAFSSAANLADALRRQGLDGTLADLVSSDKDILARVAKESARAYDIGYYSDQDVIIDDSLIVGNAGNGVVAHNSGNVWVNNSVVIGSSGGSTGTYEMNSGSLETLTVSIGKTGAFLHNGGTLEADAVDNRGRYEWNGGKLDVATFSNSGNVNVNGGNKTFAGTFVNQQAGQVKTAGANVEFTGEFINFGEYNSDPSTNKFADLYVGETGYLVGGEGDRFQVAGNFENQSRSGSWHTDKAMLEFSGAGKHDYILNDTSAGFLWGTLALDEGGSLEIGGDFSQDLVFDTIVLNGGLEQLDAIVTGKRIACNKLYDGAGHLLDVKGYEFSGGGSLVYEAVVTPEPASMVLFGLGGGALAWLRRRRV